MRNFKPLEKMIKNPSPILHDPSFGNDTAAQGEPLLLWLEPFSGPLSIPLPIEQEFQALCIHQSPQDDGFATPHYINCWSDVAAKTFLLLMRTPETDTCYLCLSHDDLQCHMEPGDTGPILHCFSGDSQKSLQKRCALIIVQGKCFNEIIATLMQCAIELTGHFGKLLRDKPPLPKWMHRLGWGTGKSPPSHAQIITAVQNCIQAGFPIEYALIDEGWQSQYQGSLVSFDADRTRFPKGIKGVIDDLHKLGIRQVGVWHALMGGRAGIHPELAKLYQLPADANNRFFLGTDLGHTFRFYNDYYAHLKKQGATYIKAGDQISTATFCHPHLDVTQVQKNVLSAVQAASSIQFNNVIAMSECLSNTCLFNWPTARLGRTSHDLNTMRSIRNHLVNGLWLQHLVNLDFDDWHTSGQDAETLAIFHALSGTPHRLGDQPHSHDALLIQRIVLPSGFILRPDKPLTLCSASLFTDPITEKTIYKAYTCKGPSGIIAAFNLGNSRRSIHGTVSSDDIEGLVGEQFAVHSLRHGFIGVLERSERLPISLKPHQSDIIAFAPIQRGVAIIGCYHFYLTYGPILNFSLDEESLHIQSRTAAPILIYCEREVLEARRNGNIIPCDYDEKRKVLTLESRSQIQEEPCIYSVHFA